MGRTKRLLAAGAVLIAALVSSAPAQAVSQNVTMIPHQGRIFDQGNVVDSTSYPSTAGVVYAPQYFSFYLKKSKETRVWFAIPTPTGNYTAGHPWRGHAITLKTKSSLNAQVYKIVAYDGATPFKTWTGTYSSDDPYTLTFTSRAFTTGLSLEVYVKNISATTSARVWFFSVGALFATY